jgi:hypothetical protein
MSQSSFALIRAFALEFQRSGLYETGFADPFRDSGATSTDDRESMLMALAYVHGSADTARLACRYQGRAWQIAHLVGIASGMLSCAIIVEESSERIERLIDQYRRELLALVASDPPFPEYTIGGGA